MKEIVKYSNELHELRFNSLTEAQQNVFFTLLQQFRNTDGYTLELDYCKIFELASIAQGTNYRKEILDKLGKLQEFKFRYESNDRGDLAQEVIFPKIETDSENRVLKIKVSKSFKDRYINSPLKGWTRYELAEFVGLSGTYAKTIYRYLKQFRQTGLWRIKYKDFKELLGIPEKYRASDIDKWILKPTMKELSAERNLFDQRRTPFKGLIIKKIKSGRSIEALEFYFKPQMLSEIEKDEKESERNLKTIANDIRRQDALKSLKSYKEQDTDILKSFLGSSIHLYDEKYNQWNILKIVSYTAEANGAIRLNIKNSDDGFMQEMVFDSITHVINFIKKNA